MHSNLYNLILETIIYFLYADKTCEPGKFYCPSGLCIPWSLTCNGVRDCPDGADEPLVCSNETEGRILM